MSERVLLINTKQKQCGAHQYLLRIFDLLKSDSRFEYTEFESESEFCKTDISVYSHVILNYYNLLFPWWNPYCHSRIYYIYHEGPIRFPVSYDLILDSDPTAKNGIPRPTFKPKTLTTFTPGKIPVIGTFGFPLYEKRFDEILRLVQEQFDEARIRISLPMCHHLDNETDDTKIRLFAQTIYQLIYKPGVKLEITHDFMDEDQLLTFLSTNDINMFLYDNGSTQRGCSSVIDYALNVNRPIAISNDSMFRHIYDDRICAYKRPIRDIMNDPTVMDHLRSIAEKWTSEQLRSTILRRLQIES